MNSSTSATSVRFDEDSMWVDLNDGRVLAVPLAWLPKLLHSTPEQGEPERISPRGLRWDALDEDISIAGPLAGLVDQSSDSLVAAA